jgi:hypothetical protein
MVDADALEDDGGLARARANFTSEAATVTQQQQADLEAVEDALRRQALRVRKTIDAFLQAAAGEDIEPERLLVGYRQTGPKPKNRVGRRLGVWGSWDQPAPDEPVYEPGYTVLDGKRPQMDSVDTEFKIVLWQSGIVDMRDVGPAGCLGDPCRDGTILPFHEVGVRNWRPGAVVTGRREEMLFKIERTTDWFVGQLAEYLETHS